MNHYCYLPCFALASSLNTITRIMHLSSFVSIFAKRQCQSISTTRILDMSSLPDQSSNFQALGSLLITSGDFDLPTLVSSIDFTKYWFMLPTCVLVATCAISAGIGGAALFGPIFLIVFPALGPQYPLQSAAAAVGIAILVESFGFSSGVIGYLRRGLIDRNTAFLYALASMPAALLASKYLTLPPILLKAAYSALMLGLGAYLIQQSTQDTSASNLVNEEEDPNNEIGLEIALFYNSAGGGDKIGSENISSSLAAVTSTTTITDSEGKAYIYPKPQLSPQGVIITAIGGALCGLLGVGIGEVTLPQLLRGGVPVPVAAATSTVVVALTCVACAEIQVSALVEAGGWSAIPWSLVIYMIPGVITGAQIAAALQGRFTKAQLERAIGTLFSVIGVAFTLLTLKQSGVLTSL